VKILFSSYAYAPSVGGIETVSHLLAPEFAAAGHEVVLVTETGGRRTDEAVVEVARQPSVTRLFQLLTWCDVLFQNNISLRHFIPALLRRKPALVVHQTWIRNTRGQIGWNDRIKRALLSHARNVAISHALAADAGVPMEIVGNPYDDDLFKVRPRISRNREIIFVGRLVSDKGADLLLRAAAVLSGNVQLTIVGTGPEEQRLAQLARELEITNRIVFAGPKFGVELAELLNQHQIIAIPSCWPEPFGIVALEGIACGCVAVGSAAGGLPEAIGNCGLTFPIRDLEQLASCLRRLLGEPELQEKFRAAASQHLEQFRVRNVAKRYLQILDEIAA
jgi:glycogen(starch) synthase